MATIILILLGCIVLGILLYIGAAALSVLCLPFLMLGKKRKARKESASK